MAQKKINGYTIHMKEVLGKGSYGSVRKRLGRSSVASRTGLKRRWQSKFYKRN